MLALAGGGSAIGSSLTRYPAHSAPAKSVDHGTPALRSRVQVAGPTVTLPRRYQSGVVACTPGTEVFGGGESNNAPGVLLLHRLVADDNTSWLVFVKSPAPPCTCSFTPGYARSLCRNAVFTALRQRHKPAFPTGNAGVAPGIVRFAANYPQPVDGAVRNHRRAIRSR